MKKTLFSFAALGALCATPLFAQEVPRANQPDPPLRPGQDAQDDAPRAVPRATTQPGQNAEERQATESRPAGQVRPAGQAQPGQRAGAQGTQVQDTQTTDFAQHAAACLILANQAEIALTEPAIEKLQNDKARELAQMIVKDHTAYISKLKQHAPQAANLKLDVKGASASGDASSASANADDASSTTNPAHANANSAQRSGSESMADKALRADKAFHERKVQMMSQQINREQGHNFDQAFLGAQVAEHVTMVAKLQALQQEVQGDEEFVQLLKQGEQSAQNHLKQAQQLMQQEKDQEHGQGTQNASGAQTQNRASDATPATPNQDR